MLLPLDTETTGFFSKNKPYDDPSQPHLVQLSALSVDRESHRVVQSLNLIVRPTDWKIPEAAQAIHGISTTFAESHGHDEKMVLDVFLSLWDNSFLIAHNLEFDKNIIATSIARNYGKDSQLFHLWQACSGDCTMRLSKPIVKALNKRGAIKWPKLSEAYEFFFNTPLSHAHSANADVVAAMEIWFALGDWEK